MILPILDWAGLASTDEWSSSVTDELA